MSIKVRLVPKDDYFSKPAVGVAEAVRREFDRSGDAQKRALQLVFCALVESGAIEESDVLTVLNADRRWEETEWEIVP